MKILIASVLLCILLAVGVGLLLLSREEAPDAIVQAELAGRKFAYVHAYARDETTGAGGLAERLSFIASFPTFKPLAAKDRASARAVTLTVTQKDDSLDPAERPAKLYARFLTPEAREGPGGLVLRDFEQGSPYDFEQLFIAPPDGRLFFARCPKPQSGAPGEGCLSMFRDGAVDVEIRYPAALLDHWDAVVDGARALLARMSTKPPPKKKS
jgi:hypothetical protein